MALGSRNSFSSTKLIIMLGFRQLINRTLHPLPVLILAVFLCILLVDAFPADSIHYHIPFAIRAFHLKGLPDYTSLNDSRYLGFPGFWRLALAPGLAFDMPRLFLIPNFLGLLLFVQICHRYLGLARYWAACCCLLFPVALLSFRTSLQDFFVNSLVASAMLILLYPLKQSDRLERVRLICWKDCFSLFLLALAANTKFQGFFMALILIILTLFFRFRDIQATNPTTVLRPRLRIGLCAFLLVLAISYQPISNTVHFRNPFYPVSVAGLPGDIEPTNSPIQYLPRVPLLFNAESFVVSSTEIDPIIRSQAGWNFQRSWHNFNKPKPQYFSPTANHPWVMTGGSNGIVFSFLAIVAVYVSFFRGQGHYEVKSGGFAYPRRLLIACALFMFLPQSMELRYYMVVLFVVAAVALGWSSRWLQSFARYVVVAAFWFALAPSFIAPIYFKLRTGAWSLDRGLLSPDPYARMKQSVNCDSTDLIWAGSNRVDVLKVRGNKKPAELLTCSLIRNGDYREKS